MGHGTNDKLFITPSEHSGVHGQHGASTGARKTMDVVVPFHTCALTHQPWEKPACLRDEGLVYEAAHLASFLDLYHVSPASGRAALRDDMIPLHFSKNAQGHWQDPVSQREFTDHSHLVVIQTTGQVYLSDTVQQLNVKAKMMQDLVTDEPFTRRDILTIQDPHDPAPRTTRNMYRT